MYQFIKTESGWIVYWGPPPCLETRPDEDMADEGGDEPCVLPFVPRAEREHDLTPAA